jgi:hypothetical protein
MPRRTRKVRLDISLAAALPEAFLFILKLCFRITQYFRHTKKVCLVPSFVAALLGERRVSARLGGRVKTEAVLNRLQIPQLERACSRWIQRDLILLPPRGE